MKKIILLLSTILIATPGFAQYKTMEDAVVSCVRVVKDGDNLADAEPALFFWSKAENKKAFALQARGFDVDKGEAFCGDHPNIPVSSRKRAVIEEAINNYVLLPEDGLKIWTTDVVFRR